MIRVAFCAMLCAAAGAAAAQCNPGSVELRGPSGTARFTVEIADTPDERAQGLMHRERMSQGAGMLFVYERPQPVAFWMRNTLIPLDMVFADATGRVTRVHSNAVPLDETPIEGGDGVLLVLEVNAGLAARLGIVPGTDLRHPVIDQSAAVWPCAAP